MAKVTHHLDALSMGRCVKAAARLDLFLTQKRSVGDLVKFQGLQDAEIVVAAFKDLANQFAGAVGGVRFERELMYVGYHDGHPKFRVMPFGPLVEGKAIEKWFAEEIEGGAMFEGSLDDCMDWCRAFARRYEVRPAEDVATDHDRRVMEEMGIIDPKEEVQDGGS